MYPDTEALYQKLAELTHEHRELDEAIASLQADPDHDQFQVIRLKKRKLLLKDMIVRIKSQLIPDLNA
ncbi:MAG: DUF465 domain-containing protein [Gammaproteobacteria bacterium]|nr:DUF465 domain-containing protein [Gammaproteobacteria bacterium]MBU1725226.1 DUF465 domain-containing protein [Gammaproteobacteria bacterium]MBU2005844.1 DUF465 domain-containing protein [Gammaproteobacteria bacterium]